MTILSEPKTVLHKPKTILHEPKTILHEPKTILPEPKTILHEHCSLVAKSTSTLMWYDDHQRILKLLVGFWSEKSIFFEMLNFEFWRLTCEQFVGFTRTNLRTSLLHRARCVTKLTHKNKNVSWVGWVSKTFKNKNISWALVKLSKYMKHFISPNTGWSLMTVDSNCFLTNQKFQKVH